MATDHHAGTRILSAADVRGLLDVPTVLELQRRAFLATLEATPAAAPNSWVRVAGQRRWLKVLAGYDASDGTFTVKAVARSAEPGSAGTGSLLMVFDAHEGSPLVVMDGAEVTLLRTAAAAALATAALAPGPVERLALIGTGRLARAVLDALPFVCPALREVRLWGRARERAAALAAEAERAHRFRVTVCADVATATADVEVIVTATTAATPVLERRHLHPGQHVNALGTRTEIAPDVVIDATVIPDARNEALVEGVFSVAVDRGLVTAEQLGPSLGEILAGRADGRSEAAAITLFDSCGIALQDALYAGELLRRASAGGVGLSLDLAGRG